MIHWAWLILAFIIGCSFGAMMMPLFIINKQEDSK